MLCVGLFSKIFYVFKFVDCADVEDSCWLSYLGLQAVFFEDFLEDEQVAFEFVYVDLLENEEREAAKDEVRKWNSRVSFPTVVIDSQECVIGYKTDNLKEALGL